MRDSAHQPRTMLAQDRDEILVGIALVEEDGLSDLRGDLELPGECAALRVARREIPEIIEPAFAGGDDRGIARRRLESGQGLEGEVRGMVRVHAGRREQNRKMRARQVPGLPRAALARTRA